MSDLTLEQAAILDLDKRLHALQASHDEITRLVQRQWAEIERLKLDPTAAREGGLAMVPLRGVVR